MVAEAQMQSSINQWHTWKHACSGTCFMGLKLLFCVSKASLKPGERLSGKNSVLSEITKKVDKTGIPIWIYWY